MRMLPGQEAELTHGLGPGSGSSHSRSRPEEAQRGEKLDLGRVSSCPGLVRGLSVPEYCSIQKHPCDQNRLNEIDFGSPPPSFGFASLQPSVERCCAPWPLLWSCLGRGPQVRQWTPDPWPRHKVAPERRLGSKRDVIIYIVGPWDPQVLILFGPWDPKVLNYCK